MSLPTRPRRYYDPALLNVRYLIYFSYVVSVGLDSDGKPDDNPPKKIPFANGTAIWALDYDFPDGILFYSDIATGKEKIRYDGE